jgi:hypothetical protein
MDYKKGDRVSHPTKAGWGLGEVLDDSKGKTVRVFFVGVGEKTLSLQYVQPIKVTGNDAFHPVLENLRINKATGGTKYQSLPQSIQFFLKVFPEGFHGDKFKKHERDYKDKAHALAQELLGKAAFDSLIGNGDFEEIVKRALRVVNATNLVFPNEKMSLKDGLVRAENQNEFSKSLSSLLYSEDNFKERDSAKWTTATYFLFIIQPEKYMFVKPTITQYAAELCGFEINYKPQLNWLTYKSILDFSNYLYSEISELKPRDMIDVQSFMWCIAPGKYGNS